MPNPMPDIANQARAQTQGTLNWVGMSQIEAPLMIAIATGQAQPVNARIEAFVSLDDPDAKGIHMSRLYLAIDELTEEAGLSGQRILRLLEQFISSHEGLSNAARVKFSFELPLRRESLLSGKKGWKSYPVEITGTLDNGEFSLELYTGVVYSSTCPCSAALARQLIQQAFEDKFSDQNLNKEDIAEWLGSTQGIVATPHSQRSLAELKMLLDNKADVLPFTQIIDLAEATLKTPVQAAVKREDEQEFARLNGQNLMFCEDSARRLQHALNQVEFVSDFHIRVNHYESLHAHDAVAVTTKGVAGGYLP